MNHHWKPRAIWNEVREKVRGWMDTDHEREVEDPNLVFHLAFTIPLLIGLAALAVRHA